MIRTTVSVAVLATAVLLSACGGGSTSPAATHASAPAATSPAAGATARPIAAAHGGFRTVIPIGYSDGTAAESAAGMGVEYTAIGPRIDGFSSHIAVFRASAGGGGVAAITARALHALEHRPSFLPQPKHISTVAALEIDGQPARALQYVSGGRESTDHSVVLVVDGPWAYQITDITLPDRRTASAAALHQVLTSWRWQ